MPDSPDGTEIEKVSAEQDAKSKADSSPASEGDKPTMLDAVASALKAKEESPASDKPDPEKAQADEESAAQKSEDGEAQADPEADDDEFTEEERTQLSERTQRRIKKLAGEVTTLKTENETFKAKAESFERIVDFARTNRLTKDDVDNTFRIAALVRNDPVKALEALTPVVDELRKMTGNVLPEDLQKQVREGYITREHATELAKARASLTLRDRRDEESREQERQRQEHEKHQGNVAATVQAADDWYAKQKTKDPDFELKQARIADRAELEILRARQNGKLFSPQEAVEMLDRIKRDVDGELRKLRPVKPALAPVEGHASAGTKAAPTTMLEAVRGAIAG